MSEYFILGPARDDEFCKIDMASQDFPSMNPASRGRSMKDVWPEDAVFRMKPRHRGLIVPDVVLNPDECLMVSDRMRAFLQRHVDTPVEYLRFTLLNHKGRVANDAMWVVNLLDSVACADMAKTEGSESPFYPGEIQDLLELHLLKEKVPANRQIFRLRECPATILVRDDLRRGIEGAGFSAEYFELGEMIAYVEASEPLDDLLVDSHDLIDRCLEALRGGELLGGAVIGEIELRYRLIGIARLLKEADQDAFRDNLHRSGCAALHLFELMERGSSLEPKNLTVQENPGFADAVVAGDMTLATRLAELSPKQHCAGYEYEDDFLRYHLLHRMLLGADDAELRGLLGRWEAVMEGQSSVPWALSTGLVERDADAFAESLLDLIAEHVVRFEEFRTNAGYIPELDASLGNLMMDGLVLLRFAEMRGIPTEREYRFMPDLARLPVGGPFPPRDAWRTPPT